MKPIQKGLKQLGVGLFSASAGISIFISTLLAMGALIGNLEALPFLLVAGFITFATATGIFSSLNTYFFQGKEILKSPEDNEENQTILVSASDEKKSYVSASMQCGYTAGNAAIIFFNRSFTFNSLFWLMDSEPSLATVLVPTTIDTALKLSFTSTNENLAACQTIAEWCDKNTSTYYCYRPIIKKLSQHEKFTKAIIQLGALEHTLIDDVIPLILTVMPKSWLSFLLSYPLISLSIAATVMLAALPIVFLIYQQTLHFEGKASLENLNQSAENKITLNSSIGCLTGKNYLKLIKANLNTMGPLHAPQAMAPLAIALQQIREQSEDYINPLTYWILGGLVTLLIGIIYGTGIHFSEVAEAKNNITKELNTLGIFGVEQEKNHSDSNVTQEYNHQKPPV